MAVEKVCRVVKPVPLVLTPNTVPVPFVPPEYVVPYRVLPDKINLGPGLAPSLLTFKVLGGPVDVVAVKACRLVKPVPSVLRAKTVPLPELPPTGAAPYRILSDKINPSSGCAPSLLV